MSTATSAITDQAGVNSAGSFDEAAAGLLDLGGSGSDQAVPQEVLAEETHRGAADDNAAGNGGDRTDGTQGDGQRTQAEGDQGKTVAAVQPDEWAMDQALLDKALADPTHGAVVKALSEQRAKLLGYRDHWSLEEAQELRALAPGGMEEMKASVEAGRQARAENLEFASGDPGRQATALKSLAADMPDAFAAGVTPYLQTLKEVNPEGYTRAVGQIATDALRAEGLPEMVGSHLAAIDALMAAAEKGDEGAFTDAFARVTGAQEFRGWADRAGIKSQAAAATRTAAKIDPEVAKLQKELEGYRAKETSAQQTEANKIVEEWNGFTRTVSDAWQGMAKPEVGKLVDIIPKNMPKAEREWMVTRLETEIMTELSARINEELAGRHGDLLKKVDAVVTGQSWKKNPEKARDQFANLVWARGKQLLPHVAAKILTPFSTATVAANQTRVAKETANAERKDLRGAGGSGPRGAGPMTVADVRSGGRYAGLSNEEILES